MLLVPCVLCTVLDGVCSMDIDSLIKTRNEYHVDGVLSRMVFVVWILNPW